MEQRQLLLAAVNYHKNIIMGILNNEYYYYFKTKNGVTTIVRWGVRINTSINRNYVELTPEQVEFYLAHPEASVEEVRNCKMNEVVEVSEDIATAIATAISELKGGYASSVKVSDLEWAAAVTDFLKQNNALTLKDVPDLMDNADSREVIKNFATSYQASRSLYAEGKAAIEAATSEEEVYSTLDTYKSRFAAL